MEKNLNRQHKRILFMISLPQFAEFETCMDNVSECINKLREKGVDVRESIHREDLATISRYDIVIIVAHHDTDNDALLLADGKLSMDDFVNSIPEDFSGELDFSSCYSASAMKAIKNRCPNCHIQASIHQTTLALRLLAYPFVIDIINEDNSIEYHDAYMKVLDMMLEAASESSETEEELPEHVKLGNQLSSVYAPSEVKRASKFMIQLILHYDLESGTILAIAKGHEPDTCWRGTLLNNLSEGDCFSIKLKFDSDNIFVVDDDNIRHNEYVKEITVGNEVVEEQFMVEVASDYSGSSFWTIISLLKENNWLPSFKFKVTVSDHENKMPADIVMETPTCNDEKFISQKELAQQLMPFFSGLNENDADGEKVKIKRINNFLSEIQGMRLKGMRPNAIVGHVIKCIKLGWIEPHVIKSNKGKLWKVLHDADLYRPTKSNWNNMLHQEGF